MVRTKEKEMEQKEMTPREWKEARMKSAEAASAETQQPMTPPLPPTPPVYDNKPEGHRAPEKTTMERAASVFSTVFSPLLVPTYGIAFALWTSSLRFLPTGVRLGVVLITFIITCVIPAAAIFGLWKTGRISDPGLNKRGERSIPYVITGLCYLACAFYLWRVHAPAWLWAFPAGGAVAVVIATFINMRWKISAHMSGMGGLLAVAFREAVSGYSAVGDAMIWWLTVLIILAGCVATSRLILRRHTLGQVLAGTALGFVAVFFLSMI